MLCSWIQFQISCIYSSRYEIGEIDIRYIILNILTNYVLLGIIYILVNSFWCSCLLFSILTLCVSVINHYTIKLHSSPLTISELGNLKTALNVIGNYDLNLKEVLPAFAIFVLECFLCLVMKRSRNDEVRRLKNILIRDICMIVSFILIIYCGYLSSASFMPELKYWTWVTPYQKYGYLPCVVKTACTVQDIPVKPNGYYEGCVDDIKIVDKYTNAKTPDIILILNESFYDLSLLENMETDVPYMENIASMENTIKGYVVNPSGGTNPSEYELLTSNSMKLMREKVPFNTLDFTDANSIVTHLKQIGYHTIGAHCAPPINYNRGMVYPAMGFDEIYFEDDFKDIAYYGNRGYATDECLYKNLLSWLEREDETPQFVYLLTIQNHGGWDLNERDLDTVHAENDFGEYDEEVDEYLSCIRLSDIAFKEFTDRLKDIDRDIIVCMVGDHGPSFTSKMAGDSESDQSWLLRTSVPFVIWANFTLPDEVCASRGNMIQGMPLRYETENRNDIAGQCISMNYLAPTLLNIAQVELSPYYQYMLELKSKIPVLTPFVVYFDKSGSAYAYDSSSEYTEMVNNYLYLEYNNLQKNREQRLFDPYKDLR